MPKEIHPIYNIQFGLLCLSSFFFSASFNMLIPELPAYLDSMGGGEYKGLIIGLFTITAAISRPFSGKLTDTVGRIPIMAIGSIVCFVCGFLYPLFGGVFAFLLLRLIHGFSTGFKPTATATYVADIIPVSKWGTALGIHGLCFSTGMAIGPAIGSVITSMYSINILFYCSSFFALMSILILMNMKETLRNRQRFNFSLLKISRHEVIEKQVLPAALVTFLTYVSYGALLTVVPDWSTHLGVSNKGVFFTVFTLSSLLIRFLAGKVSDRYGRITILKVALTLLILSLVFIGIADSGFELLAASAVYGIATGILSPTSSAWTIDLSHPDRRGKAMATMFIALEAGIGLGALGAGWMFRNSIKSVPLIFYLSAIMALFALTYLLLMRKERNFHLRHL